MTDCLTAVEVVGLAVWIEVALRVTPFSILLQRISRLSPGASSAAPVPGAVPRLVRFVTVAYEILRQIRRERMNLPGYSVVVNAHPAVIDLLKNDERIAVQEAERLFQRRIDLVPRKEYHLEQFDLQGR